jgi:short-subunit dehydrogenase
MINMIPTACAFAPLLANPGGGAVLIPSMQSLDNLPRAATYAASKAASLSLTRSIRAELGAKGTQVVGVLAVQTEAEWGARMTEPRTTPQELVSDVLDAVAADASDEIVAGAQSRQVYQQFIVEPTALKAMMLTRLRQRW